MPDFLDARKLPSDLELRASAQQPQQRRVTDSLKVTERLNPFELEKRKLFVPPPETGAIIERHRVEIPQIAQQDPYFFDFFTKELARNFHTLKAQIQHEHRQGNVYDDGLTERITGIAAVQTTNAVFAKEVELMTDELTGMPNRVYQERVLEFWLQKAMEGGFPLTYMEADMDGFKLVNTLVGHAGGDELIKASTKIGKSPLRELEVVGRKQGDELFFILPGVGLTQAAATGQVIADRSKAYLINEVPGEKLAPDDQISLSGGIATFDPAIVYGSGRAPGEDADQTIRRILSTHGGVKRFAAELTDNADIALSHAKSIPGKNRFETYTFGMQRVTDLPINR